MAYWAKSDAYANLGETTLSAKSSRKAFELRARVSELERLLIECYYNYSVSGDLPCPPETFCPNHQLRLALDPHPREILGAAAPYELGLPAIGFYNWPNLYPVYVRGESYLAAHQGKEAAAEFQRILDHRGTVLNEPIGALAHLQLGRAYSLQGDTAKSRAAYQDFFTLWKDADPDIPILIAAKAEYAKLQ